MNEITIKDDVNVEDMIYEIRGKQVMLDSDLARLYDVETKRINEAVKNNPLKFPERFFFRITEEEYSNLKSKISTSSLIKHGGSRKGHSVFTEQGVAMLATILKSKVATEVSIRIMDAFVAMRHYILDNKDIYKSLNYINNKLIEHDKKFEELFSKFNRKEQLFLPGEVYDAYSKIIDILSEAQQEIIIIDSYADKSILDFIENINSNIILITSNKAKLSDVEVEKFNKQFNDKLKVIKDDTFHDRYFILDNSIVYLCGSSINYAGNKVFNIILLEDKIIKDNLLNYINKII